MLRPQRGQQLAACGGDFVEGGWHDHVRVYSLRWRPESVFTTHQRGASPRLLASQSSKIALWLALLYLLLLDASQLPQNVL